MSKQTISLDKYLPAGVAALNNRSWGIALRNASGIDKLAKTHEFITINFPKNISHVSTSFLEEFLENIVMEMGSDFNKRVSYHCEGHYKIKPYIDEAVSHILKVEVA